MPDPLAKRLRCFFRNARRNSGRRTAALNITQSMSRKGNCWDNAPMESFFGTLKTELVHHREYPDRDTARRDLFAYIEGYYNRRRIHSAIGYITPQQAEAKYA
jgi:putative transposase